jgi:type II secretory pathway pseudopilin PulG
MRAAEMKTGKTAGFTLIEVLLAFLLFVTIYGVFAQSKGGSEQNVRQNMKRDIAIRLLQAKMTEIEMKLQKEIDKNGVETSYAKDAGKFEDPYSEFNWSMKFQAPTIKFSADVLTKFLTDMGMDKDEAMAQIDQQKLLITNLNKNILANFGELIVEVTWDYIGTQKQSLLTHLIPKQPKVTLTTTAETE